MTATGETPSPLANPCGGQAWFHGTGVQFDRDLLEDGFADPLAMDPGGYEDPDSEDGRHWNALLGTHFAASHTVAEEFANGLHQSSANECWGEEEEFRGVVHARVHVTNPRVYDSEYDMDREAYAAEWEAGNHPGNHLELTSPDDPDEEDLAHLEDSWPDTWRLMRRYGTGRIPADAWDELLDRPAVTTWLITHPDRHDIACRFRERLQAAGHDGAVYCADTETEILTLRGWLRYDEVTTADTCLTLNVGTGTAEWQPVESVHVFRGRHDVIRIEHKAHSSVTTPGHRWPVWLAGKRKNPGWQWRTTALLPQDAKICAAAPVSGVTEPKWTDALVELMAWFWTEGYTNPDKRGQGCSITQSQTANPGNVVRIRSALTSFFGPDASTQERSLVGSRGWQNREKIRAELARDPNRTNRAIAAACGITPRSGAVRTVLKGRIDPPAWTEDVNSRKISTFRLNPPAAAMLTEHLVGDVFRKIVSTEFLSQLTPAQLELFIQVSIDADGTWHKPDRNGRRTAVISQKDRARTDAFQVACALAGKSGSVRPAKDGSWRFCLWASNPWRGLQAGTRRVQEQADTVWCPQTRNATWFARRRGTAYFTGNSNEHEKDLSRSDAANTCVVVFDAARIAVDGFHDVDDPGPACDPATEPTAPPDAENPGLTWDQIGEMYPGVYGTPAVHGDAAEDGDGEGIGDAVNQLANSRPEDPDAENTCVWDLTFRRETVDPRRIDWEPHGHDDPHVQRAYDGYARAAGMPPLVLVHRHGTYKVADGSHRAEAAQWAGVNVDAFVHYSRHENDPDGAGYACPAGGQAADTPGPADGGGGETLTHGQWMTVTAALAGRLEAIPGQVDGMYAGLTCATAGRDQINGVLALGAACADWRDQVTAMLTAVNATALPVAEAYATAAGQAPQPSYFASI